MRTSSIRWLRRLLLASIYMLGALGIVGSGGGGNVSITAVYISQPKSPTYESEIRLSGSFSYILSDTDNLIDNSFYEIVTARWHNNLNGKSGSVGLVFERVCTPFIPICATYVPDGYSFWILLAVGNNPITVTVGGKQALVSVIRKEIDYPAPAVTTLEATLISDRTATISGSINPGVDVIDAWFEWGTDSTLATNFSTTHINIPYSSTTTTIDEGLVGLSIGTTYYYRVVAMNKAGTSKGNILNFKTQGPPGVITSPAMQLYPRESTLSGSVNPNEIEANAWFQLGFDPEFAAYATTSPMLAVGAGQTFVPVDHLFDQLSTGTKYYYRLNASNYWGTAHGDTLSFTTPLAGDTCWAKIYRSYIGSVTQEFGALGTLTTIENTADNGYIMAAYSKPAVGQPEIDLFSLIIKTNAEGGVEWSRSFYNTVISNPVTYPYYTNLRINIVKEIGDSKYIFAGELVKVVADGSERQGWIGELNENGDVVWQKTYGEPIFLISDIEVLPDGFIVAGSGVLKLDQNGNIVWKYKYLDGFIEIEVANDEYIVVGGSRVLKLDQNGNIVWQIGFSGVDIGGSFKATVTADGVIVGGNIIRSGSNYDIFVLTLANDGSINWANVYGSGRELIKGIKQTSDGGYIVSGLTLSSGTGRNAWLLKLNNMGSIEWQKQYMSIDPWHAGDTVREASGGGYIIGSTGSGPYYNVIKLFKTDSVGSCPPLDSDISTVSVATDVVNIPSASTRMPLDLIAATSDNLEVDTPIAIDQIVP